MADMATAGGSRQLYIDNLRNLAVMALVVFHTARLFDGEPWHIKDAATYGAADAIVQFMNVWHMPVLFLLAGMSALLAIAARGAGQFAGDRFWRLFVPLVAGIFLVVLPQVYLERISPHVPGRASPIDFDGSLPAFVPRFFDCCYADGNFSWHHLWFLIYLFVFSLVLLPVLLAMRRSGTVERIAGWLANGWRPLLLGVPLIAVELALRQSFPSTHALADDWANNAHFMLLILFGGLVAIWTPLGLAIARIRLPMLLIGVALAAVWFVQPALPEALAAWAMPIGRTVRTSAEWTWLLALLGYGRALLDRRVPYVTAFSRHALPFYIFHQAIIVWLGWLLFSWSGDPLAKFALIAITAAVVSYGLARLFDLSAATRWLVGLKGSRRRVASAPSAAAVLPG